MKNPLIAGLVLTGLLASPVAVGAIALPGAAEPAEAAPSQSSTVSEATIIQTNVWQDRVGIGKPNRNPPYICDQDGPSGLSDPGTTDLIAGQHNVVGNVTFEVEGGKLRVTYQTDSSDLVITEAHLYVGNGPPRKSAPGRFPYHWPGKSGDSPSSTVVFEVDYPGGCQTIAAHSVVEDRSVPISYTGIGLDELPGLLPTAVDFCVKKPGDTYLEDSYFDARILNSFSPLPDGIYDAYCVDTRYQPELSADLLPDCTVAYSADVYSSYGDLPADLITEPDYLDEVNWLINQDYVGMTSPTPGYGDYTWGDLQRAIWDMLSPSPPNPLCDGCGLGSWTQERANELLAMALANGSGFEPTCGERVAIVLDPSLNTAGERQQPIIVWIELPCIPEYGDETAWAGPFSCQFTTGWGWFFEFCEDD